MSIPPSATWWVPGPVHLHALRVWKGWVTVLAITVAVGILVFGSLLVRSVLFDTPHGRPVFVSSPRDCRVGGDPAAAQLYVAVDVTRIDDAYLLGASSPGPYGKDVAAISVLPSLPSLSTLSDADVLHLVNASEDSTEWAEGDPPTGVILVVIDVGEGPYGQLDGLTTRWSLGEPVTPQDLPLGITVTTTSCTVTRAT